MSTFEDQLAVALRAHAATLAPTPVKTRRRRWPLIAVPIATAAAIAVFASPSQRTTPVASAAELLRTAATAAEREVPLRPDQYLYVRIRYQGRIGTGVQERWTHPDGTGRVVRREGGRVVEDRKLRRGEVPTGTVDVEREAQRVIAENPGFDPAQLRAYISYRTLHEVLDAPVPGPVRAQAYRTLSTVPGLRILRRDGDRVLLATRVGDVEFRARIDTGDGRVLALERVLLRRSKQIPGEPRVVDRSVVEAIRRL